MSPVSPNPKFSQRPFVAGSITGLRSFRVEDGKLHAINQYPESEWTPGENVAVCHRKWSLEREAMYYSGGLVNGFQMLPSGRLVFASGQYPEDAPEIVVPEHDIASMDCYCGFYAYFDRGHNEHHEPGNMLGIVEGYGLITVGERGFRCSKARIRALIGADDIMYTYGVLLQYNFMPGSPIRPEVAARIRSNYRDIPFFPDAGSAMRQFPLTPPSDVPAVVPVETFKAIIDEWTSSDS